VTICPVLYCSHDACLDFIVIMLHLAPFFYKHSTLHVCQMILHLFKLAYTLVFVHAYVCMSVGSFIWRMYECLCIRTYGCTVCIYKRMSIRTYVGTFVWARTFVQMTYVHTIVIYTCYTYIYTYISYVHIYIFTYECYFD